MVRCVYASPGVTEQFQQVFPGQPKIHEDESEWEELLYMKSWHIDTGYFFIKDQVDKEELSIVYFPTHLMLAGYPKKPLQRSLLHKFRKIIMVRVSNFKLI